MQNGVQIGLKVGSLLAAIVLLAGCTGRGGSGGGGGLTVQAKRGAFEFVPANVSATAGGSTPVTLQNPDTQIHDWTIDSVPIGGTAQKIQVLSDPGKNTSQTFVFSQAGTYRVYCSQPGHAEAGMVGQLTVQ